MFKILLILMLLYIPSSYAGLNQTWPPGQATMANSQPVAIASDQSAVSTSRTWTTSSGTDSMSCFQSTASSLNAQVVGNVASAATDSGNPIKIGSIANTTLPTVTTGQRIDAQSDLNGRIYVNSVPLDGSKTTYRAASAAVFASAATATDICTLTGSGTKTIKLTKMILTGIQSTTSVINLFVVKRSTANTAGTSTALTAVPMDSNNAAATATALQYTANPTTGTLVGTLESFKMVLPVTAIGGNASPAIPPEVKFGDGPSQAVTLRGTSQVVAFNLGSTTISGGSWLCTFEWTEE